MGEESLDVSPVKLLQPTGDNNSGDLSIVIHNADHSMALVYLEKEGYPALESQWEFHNDNIEMELHIGTNVGRDYCTETTDEGQITQRFTPIDIAELPAGVEVTENPVFSFFLDFPACEGCKPIITVEAKAFWLVSDAGQYMMVDTIQSTAEMVYF